MLLADPRICTLALLLALGAVSLKAGPLASVTPAVNPAIQKEVEEWRAKHEASYRKEYVVLAGLFFLSPGANTAGSAATNQVVLPKSVAPNIGRFVLEAGRVRFEPAPGSHVTLKKKPVTSPIELQSDENDAPDELEAGGVAFWVHVSGERRAIRLRDEHGEIARGFAGFHWFPIDESYRVTARFIKDPAPHEVHTPNLSGDDEVMTTEGVVEFTLKGQKGPSPPGHDRAEALLVHLQGRHERQGNLRDRAVSLRRSARRWDRHPRLQRGVQPAVRLQPVHDVPAAAEGKPAEDPHSRRREGVLPKGTMILGSVSRPSRRGCRPRRRSAPAAVPGGLEAVERLAASMAARGARPAVVWHSGKLRAKQTAEAFWRACNALAEFSATRDLQPDDSPEWMRDRLRGETRDILLAGHFPHMGRLLAHLRGGPAGGLGDFPLHGAVALVSEDEGATWSELWRLGSQDEALYVNSFQA